MGIYSNCIFPAAYDFLMRNPRLAEHRRSALAPVRGRILEIGIGTGLSLKAYPRDVEKIWAVDSNAGMLKKLAVKGAAGGIAVEASCAGAESLPYDDNAFDTVACTHVLCSLPELARSLDEIRRVLRPDGQFVFLEHGLSPEARVARWQRRLNAIQKRFAVGCTLDLPLRDVIPQAGFRFETLEEYYLKREAKTHGYLYQGVAVPA